MRGDGGRPTMRYTAKARMLSFDFMSDDVVYRLPLVQALLLAGMITRADNLGRLPGDPSVLLAYLFNPKPPRVDVRSEDVEGLLVTLSLARSGVPPKRVLHWYEVDGLRVVQFTNWKSHQSLREHSMKSTLPAPDAKGVVDVPLPGDQVALFEGPLKITVTDEGAQARFDVRAMIRSAAAAHSMDRALNQYDEDQVREFCGRHDMLAIFGSVGYGLKFSHWLWKDGVRPMESVLALLRACAEAAPRNPYAYFAKGGPGRDVKISQANAKREVDAHEEIKREERALLGDARRTTVTEPQHESGDDAED